MRKTGKITSFVDKVLDWYSENGRDFPWRHRDTDPYNVLVAEVMLKRTTSTHVLKVYEKFLERFPDVDTLASARSIEIEKLIQPLGLHRQRARLLKSMAKQVVIKHRGKIPRSLNSLMELDGVGEYIAKAVYSIRFGGNVLIYDSNVKRIIDRFFVKTDGGVLELVGNAVPIGKFREFNLGVVDFGALVCRPQYPNCQACTLRKSCAYFRQTKTS